MYYVPLTDFLWCLIVFRSLCCVRISLFSTNTPICQVFFPLVPARMQDIFNKKLHNHRELNELISNLLSDWTNIGPFKRYEHLKLKKINENALLCIVYISIFIYFCICLYVVTICYIICARLCLILFSV